jgi:GNAT superfamily N-acetyltransferase
MIQAVPGLEVVRAQSDADLEVMIAVRTAADPDRPPPRLGNLRHNLAANDTLVYVIARIDGEPAGCGFVDPWPDELAPAHLVVVPGLRRRGIGSALLAELGRRASEAGRPELEGEVVESDVESRTYLERRGYRVVGGEKAVALDLMALEPEPAQVQPGVEIVALADRPELAEALFAVGIEAAADIPGSPGDMSFEQWRAIELDRPTRRRDLLFVAVVDGKPVGYVSMDDSGRDGYNGLTAVRRAWRRRGIATALKQTQIAAAKLAGFERLITGSEERNLPMRTLNAKLGYRPEPSRSALTMRGPADVRLQHGRGGGPA